MMKLDRIFMKILLDYQSMLKFKFSIYDPKGNTSCTFNPSSLQRIVSLISLDLSLKTTPPLNLLSNYGFWL